MADTQNGSFDITYYQYNPSLPAAITLIVLFSLTGAVHGVQAFKPRAWYLLPFMLGGNFESIGYFGRTLSAKEAPHFTMRSYIMQSILILLGPILFNASFYMIFTRLMRFVRAEHYSLIPVNWLTPIFVLGDAISLGVQGAGSGLFATATTKDGAEMARRIIIGGLSFQIFWLVAFTVTIVVFHYRILSNPETKFAIGKTPQIRYLFVLYAAIGLIMVRTVYRLTEYGLGLDSWLSSNEAYFYALDGAQIVMVTFLFNIFHPGRVLRGQFEERQTTPLSSDLETQNSNTTGTVFVTEIPK